MLTLVEIREADWRYPIQNTSIKATLSGVKEFKKYPTAAILKIIQDTLRIVAAQVQTVHFNICFSVKYPSI